MVDTWEEEVGGGGGRREVGEEGSDCKEGGGVAMREK